MTELELFLMKVPGLTEMEAKSLIELLKGLDDFNIDRLNKLKLLLVEHGLAIQESEMAVNLLLQFQELKVQI